MKSSSLAIFLFLILAIPATSQGSNSSHVTAHNKWTKETIGSLVIAAGLVLGGSVSIIAKFAKRQASIQQPIQVQAIIPLPQPQIVQPFMPSTSNAAPPSQGIKRILLKQPFTTPFSAGAQASGAAILRLPIDIQRYIFSTLLRSALTATELNNIITRFSTVCSQWANMPRSTQGRYIILQCIDTINQKNKQLEELQQLLDKHYPAYRFNIFSNINKYTGSFTALDAVLYRIVQENQDSDDNWRIVYLLATLGADLNRHSAWGLPLYLVLTKGRFDIAQILLDHGALINQENGEGLTSLEMFLYKINKFEKNPYQLQIIKFLLDNGADVLHKNNKEYVFNTNCETLIHDREGQLNADTHQLLMNQLSRVKFKRAQLQDIDKLEQRHQLQKILDTHCPYLRIDLYHDLHAKQTANLTTLEVALNNVINLMIWNKISLSDGHNIIQLILDLGDNNNPVLSPIVIYQVIWHGKFEVLSFLNNYFEINMQQLAFYENGWCTTMLESVILGSQSSPRENEYEIVKFLLDSGSDVLHENKQSPHSSLQALVQNENLRIKPEVRQLLKEAISKKLSEKKE